MGGLDLYEALEKHYGSREEALEELKSFSDFLKRECKTVILDIENLIMEETRDNNLCPDCFNSLDKKMILNERVEYQGYEVQEEIATDYCSNCGWSSSEE